MGSAYDIKNLKIRAINKDVIVTNMDFGEIKTTSGIVLRSDDAQAHGVKPRWGRVYKVGPQQNDVTVGQWILVEHGRWTRKLKINDGDGVKEIQKIDIKAILAVSDHAPTADDILVKDSGY